MCILVLETVIAVDQGVWTSGPPSPTVNFGNNGQYNLLNENKLTRVWQSTYEPDFFYIWAMGASNQLWFYKINRHTMKIVQRSGGGSGDFYDGQPIFFHEDEEYLWGFVRPNNTSVNDHGQRIFYCEKSTLIFNWFGHINDGNRTSHLISANDKKFVTMTQWSIQHRVCNLQLILVLIQIQKVIAQLLRIGK